MSSRRERNKRSTSRSHSPSNRKLSPSSKSSKERKHKHRDNRHKKSNRSRRRSRSVSSSRSRSRDRSHKKRKKSKHKKSKKRKRSYSPSLSPSDSSYCSTESDSSSSSSSSSYKRKRKKRKKDKKKHRKSKKHKKSKKKKSKRKYLLNSNGICKPSQYREGMHGFISINDYYHKMPEFTAWLIDIHGVCIDNIVKRDEKKWFAKFCDDWNTSTMPDDKYYDLDKWNKANGGDPDDMNAVYHMSDEQKLSAMKKEQRQKEQDKRYSARVQEMKRQLIQLKSNNKREFQSLNDQYIPKKETFESLAAKRQAKKVEDRVKRFGKYDTNYTLD